MSGIDFDQVQILMLELQPEIIDSIRTPAAAMLRRAVNAVIEIASALSIPVVASVFQVGARPPTLIDELGSHDPLPRTQVSALDNPAVRDRLAQSGRRILAIGGISSEIAVLHAVLHARDAGYEVHVLADCCGGLSERTDAAALRRMERSGAHASSVSSFFTSAGGDANPAVMRALATLWSWNDTGERDDSPEHLVAKLLEELRGAWRAGDAARFAQAFAPGARFVAFDGTALKGPEAIVAYHRGPFQTYLAGTELELHVQDIRALADDVYLVASEGGIAREGASEGDQLGASAQTFVMARQAGAWSVQAFHNTRVRPITGPESARAWKEFDRTWSAQESRA